MHPQGRTLLKMQKAYHLVLSDRDSHQRVDNTQYTKRTGEK